jgi:uncharacterized protein YjbI with pentapeptide repeats
LRENNLKGDIMNDSEKPNNSNENRQLTLRCWMIPFAYFEWKCERLSKLLKRWAFLDVLGYAGRLTVIIAVFFYFIEKDDRQKTKHYQAWQTINVAQGTTCNGGRIEALQDLNKDGISLAGVDVSKAHLPKLDLRRSDLLHANFAGSILWDTKFAFAKVFFANFDRANLTRANLFGAKLQCTNFTNAIFYEAVLKHAQFLKTDLTGANFSNADLTNAILWDSNLTGANLSGANLAKAQLTGADLTNIEGWQGIKNIAEANIHDVRNPPDGFLDWVKRKGAIEKDEKAYRQAHIRLKTMKTRENVK